MDDKELEYILGTGIEELERLAIQHRLWASATSAAWDRAGIGLGHSVLDFGCGPGNVSFDLAQLVGREGKVYGIDQSRRFVNYVNQQAKNNHIPQIEARLGSAEEVAAIFPEKNNFDFVYARWLLCWLPNPERAIEQVFQLLKPGGKFIIHDYFNWGTMAMAPRSAAFEKAVRACVETFDEAGGDIEIAARLPKILKEQGFSISHKQVHQKIAWGGTYGSDVWWMITFFRNFVPRLKEMGKLSGEEAEEVFGLMKELESNDEVFCTCPPLFEFIATKS